MYQSFFAILFSEHDEEHASDGQDQLDMRICKGYRGSVNVTEGKAKNTFE